MEVIRPPTQTMFFNQGVFMKIMKGIAVILAGLLFAAAHAGTEEELRDLLDNKRVVYDGVCWFDAKNILTFKAAEKKAVKRCVVGMELPDQTKHYLLLLDSNNTGFELLVYDETTKTQQSLWKRGVSI